MRPTDFWPFVENVTCVICLKPVPSRLGVPVNAGGVLRGLRHATCSE